MLNKFETLLIGVMVVIEYDFSDSKVYSAKVIMNAEGEEEFLVAQNLVMLSAIEHHEKVVAAFGFKKPEWKVLIK